LKLPAGQLSISSEVFAVILNAGQLKYLMVQQDLFAVADI